MLFITKNPNDVEYDDTEQIDFTGGTIKATKKSGAEITGISTDKSNIPTFIGVVKVCPDPVVISNVAPVRFKLFPAVPYLFFAVGCFFTAIVEIVSFTSISNVSDFPSYVTVIVCFKTVHQQQQCH